jgi:phosphopantetheinyl transferase
MNRVILYHATLPDGLGAADFAGFVERLPYAKRVGLAPSARERMLSLAGIALALSACAEAAGRPMAPESLLFPPDERPRFADAHLPVFSVSHSGRTVVAAAANAGALGVDIEDAGESSLAPAARSEWSAREAAAKALGRGLRGAADVRLAGMQAFLDGRELHLQPIRVEGIDGWLATDSGRCIVQSFDADPLLEIRRLAA